MGPGSPPGIGIFVFSQFLAKPMKTELEEVREGMRVIIRGGNEKELAKVEA